MLCQTVHFIVIRLESYFKNVNVKAVLNYFYYCYVFCLFLVNYLAAEISSPSHMELICFPVVFYSLA